MDDVFQPAPARTELTRRAVCALLLAARPVRPASVTAAGPLLAVIAAGTDAYSQAMAGISDGLANAVPLDSLDLAAVPQPDDDSVCRSQGYEVGSSPYVQCRKQLDNQHVKDDPQPQWTAERENTVRALLGRPPAGW